MHGGFDSMMELIRYQDRGQGLKNLPIDIIDGVGHLDGSLKLKSSSVDVLEAQESLMIDS
jgi:hypothetical protein